MRVRHSFLTDGLGNDQRTSRQIDLTPMKSHVNDVTWRDVCGPGEGLGESRGDGIQTD